MEHTQFSLVIFLALHSFTVVVDISRVIWYLLYTAIRGIYIHLVDVVTVLASPVLFMEIVIFAYFMYTLISCDRIKGWRRTIFIKQNIYWRRQNFPSVSVIVIGHFRVVKKQFGKIKRLWVCLSLLYLWSLLPTLELAK